ncbi:MAG: hypothetical protein ACTSVY_07940, partial [Candidatus Helarchaeota archaeon]
WLWCPVRTGGRERITQNEEKTRLTEHHFYINIKLVVLSYQQPQRFQHFVYFRIHFPVQMYF